MTTVLKTARALPRTSAKECRSHHRQRGSDASGLVSIKLGYDFPDDCKLTLNRPSENVGGVKYFSSVRIRALGRARRLVLVEELPYQPRLVRNRFQVRNSVRTIHLFDHNLDHDF
jgi:hypothetical protein